MYTKSSLVRISVDALRDEDAAMDDAEDEATAGAAQGAFWRLHGS